MLKQLLNENTQTLDKVTGYDPNFVALEPHPRPHNATIVL